MKRGQFKPPSPQKVKELNEKKRQKALERQKSPSKKSKPKKRVTKRKTKTSRAKATTALWNECKRITRGRFENTCYTCGAQNLEGSNCQTGHGKPKGALPLQFKYDIRNLRIQCMKCNIHHGGVSDVFIAKLEQEEEGLAFLEEACEKTDGVWRIKQQSSMGGKEGTEFLLDLIEKYKQI